MSDPNCRSDARVELATAIGTWLGPILGAIATVLMANVLTSSPQLPAMPRSFRSFNRAYKASCI
ncbi:unnamed protein product [Penicillium camemberti]|uniref:Str. FM013 n=1 Tax=Penicillium camemberti (strain FM 013) TaxID=1429867 RepID=A0A0G4PYL1_PENC3|nr:unnamed protein product [Penicillium camemberti]